MATTGTSRKPSCATAGATGTAEPAPLSAAAVTKNEWEFRNRIRQRRLEADEPMSLPTPVRYRLVIDDVPIGLNRLMRMNPWQRNRLKDKWILLVRHALGDLSMLEPPPKKRRAEVRITQVRKRLLDEDNLEVKMLLDALTHWGLIFDDDPKHCTRIVDQERADGRDPQTIVEIRW